MVKPARTEVPPGYIFSPWNLSVADSADPEKNKWLVNSTSHRAWDPVSGQADYKKISGTVGENIVKWTRREFTKNFVAIGATVATSFAFVEINETQADCIRPPGALSENEFLSTCIRCGRCGEACPNRCITAFSEEYGKKFSSKPGKGQTGTPVIFSKNAGL